MKRRGFLGLLVGGVAVQAAIRTFPFRVFSFSKELQLANVAGLYRGAPYFLRNRFGALVTVASQHDLDYWTKFERVKYEPEEKSVQDFRQRIVDLEQLNREATEGLYKGAQLNAPQRSNQGLPWVSPLERGTFSERQEN